MTHALTFAVPLWRDKPSEQETVDDNKVTTLDLPHIYVTDLKDDSTTLAYWRRLLTQLCDTSFFFVSRSLHAWDNDLDLAIAYYFVSNYRYRATAHLGLNSRPKLQLWLKMLLDYKQTESCPDDYASLCTHTYVWRV